MIQEIASLSFWGGGIFLGRYADGYLYGRSVKGWYDLPAPLFLKDFEVVEQLTLKDKLNLENDNWPLEFLNQQGSLLEIKMHNRLSLSIKKVIKFDEL